MDKIYRTTKETIIDEKTRGTGMMFAGKAVKQYSCPLIFYVF